MAKPIKFTDIYIELPDGEGQLDQYYVTGYYWVTSEPWHNVKRIEDVMIDKVDKNGELLEFARECDLSEELREAINDNLDNLI